MRIILRVDDCGRKHGDPPEHGTDGDLKYFQEWREASILAGMPVVYGFTASWLTEAGIDWLRENIIGQEVVALHGTTHGTPDANVKQWLLRGKEMLEKSMCSVDALIPPYNKCDEAMIHAWASCGGRYLLGGFSGEDHFYGSVPIKVNGVIHLPATRQLYDRASLVSRSLKELAQCDYPLVVTLHCPWDHANLSSVRALVSQLAGSLVSLKEVDEWLARH